MRGTVWGKPSLVLHDKKPTPGLHTLHEYSVSDYGTLPPFASFLLPVCGYTAYVLLSSCIPDCRLSELKLAHDRLPSFATSPAYRKCGRQTYPAILPGAFWLCLGASAWLGYGFG